MNNFRWTILAALLLTTSGVAHAQSPSPSASPMPLSSISSSSSSSSMSSSSSSTGSTGSTAASAGGVADSGVISNIAIDLNPFPPGPSGATPGIENDKPVQVLEGSASSMTTTTTTVTTTVHSAGKHHASPAQVVEASAGGTLVNTGGEPLLVSIIGLSMALSALFVRRRVTD